MQSYPLLNPDFRDILRALSEAGAEFLVVGAYALAAHGAPRATGDLDVFVRPTLENAHRVWRALQSFGAPLNGVTVDDFHDRDVVYQMGLPPSRIDVITDISGVDFEEAWRGRIQIELDGVCIPVLGFSELIRNKRASARPKDLVDVATLEGLATRRPDPPAETKGRLGKQSSRRTLKRR